LRPTTPKNNNLRHVSLNSTSTATWEESSLLQQERQLKGPPTPSYCDDFKFEFSIDGKVTSWNQEQFEQSKHNIQRVVEIVTLVEDPDLTGGQEQEVELAFRMTGCGHDGRTFSLSHVYWA
jgi:hypothetical protein